MIDINKIMETLNIWLQAFIILLTQFIFIYYRTVNVNANIEKDRWKLFWTGSIVHITWLISTAIGVNAIIKGNYLLVIFSLVGGLIGADFGLHERLKINKK